MNFVKRFYFLAIVLVSSWCTSAYAKYTFQGVENVTLEKLYKKIPAARQDIVDYAVVDEIIAQLVKLNDFERVTAVEIDGNTVEFRAIMRKALGPIRLTGNDNFSNRQLLEVLSLSEGERLENKKVIEAGQRLDQFYQDQGYFNARIEVLFGKEKSAKDLNVEFKIRENEPCVIKQVILQSPNTPLINKLQTKLKKYIRRPFSLDTTSHIEKSINEHFKDERYLRASLQQVEARYNKQRTEATLVYSINEPYKYELVIDGNKYFSVQSILRIVKFDEFDREVADPMSDITERIQKEYLDTGFHHIKIRSEMREREEYFTRQIFLYINEGPRVKLLNIVIKGDITLKPSYFKTFIKDNSSDLIAKGYYNRHDLTVGYKNLETDLKNQGFLQARIQSERVEFTSNNSMATVTVTVFEGPLTQVRRVAFTGAKAFSQQKLMDHVDLQSNKPLKLYQLESAIKTLKEFYQNNGYLEMKILNENKDLITYYSEGTQANIEFKIEEGPQIIVAAIALEGNKYTKNYVILKELDFEEGDVLTPEKIEESKELLNKTGHFNRVDIRTLEQNTPIAKRTVVVSVSERQPGLFTLGAGFTSELELTARGFVGLAYRNIGGTGRAATSRLELRQNVTGYEFLQNRITLGYMEPYIFMTRVKGRVNATHDESITDYSKKKTINRKVATIRRSDRVDFLLDTDITSHIKFTWTLWSLDLIKEYQEPVSEPTFSERLLRIATVGPTLDIDYRDDPLSPSKGHFYRWDVSYSDPMLGSSTGVDFIRTTMAYTYYLPVYAPRWVWANGLRGGYLKNLSKLEKSGVPVSQAFFLGGPTTIRGFSRSTDRERIPNQTELPIDESNDLLIKGESHFYLVKSELRFPFIGDFGGAIFYDGGAVLVSGIDFDKTYRHAAGFGLRYKTPVGDVSLDIGIKLDPQPKEAKHQIYLSFGSF